LVLHPADIAVLELRIDVVEVEHDRISLPAVDTRVRPKKLVDDALIHEAAALPCYRRLGHVSWNIPQVVLPPVLATAGQAVRASGAAGPVLDRERVEGLLGVAAGADASGQEHWVTFEIRVGPSSAP